MGQIRGRRCGIHIVEALRVFDQSADPYPQVPAGSRQCQLVPVPGMEPPGPCQRIAEHDLPAALRQAALHHIGRVDGVVPGDGIELEGHTAVVALLRVQNYPRLHPSHPCDALQRPAVPLVQIDACEPVVRHILPIQIGGGDALYIGEDAAEGGIDHHRDHGDDADRDQAGGRAAQIPHKVFPDHPTTPAPAQAPGSDSPQRIRFFRFSSE